MLADESIGPSQAKIAQELSMTEKMQ